MSPVNEPLTEFERNARVVLEQSLSRIDGRTRSRLNQARQAALEAAGARRDRKSTRLNSSHRCISYAVFCLKKKNTNLIGSYCMQILFEFIKKWKICSS